ncbi:MAG: cytochrome c oxidase subunit II [bacterium P3]|nr:MAG: cytochrome c oxidase subunit II [bacterium P3]KWW42605.1 MAG: cytochrome c oxidase subunit II [bacterium F083]
MKYRSTLILALLATISSMSQPSVNDSTGACRWSMNLQAGIGNHHGMRGDQYAGHRRSTPFGSLGVSYRTGAAWRLNFNLGYACLHRVDHTLPSAPPVITAYIAPLPPADYTDRNLTHLLVTDLSLDFNFMELWPQRREDRLGIWLGAGVGYLHGWNRHDVTWEFATAGGTDWTERCTSRHQSDALCLPFTLSVEYGLTPGLTVGLAGQYSAVPLHVEHTPHGLWHLAAIVRYDWCANHTRRSKEKEMIMQKLIESYRDQAEYRDLLRRATTDNNQLIDTQMMLRADMDSMQRENDRLTELVIDLRDERARMRKLINKDGIAAIDAETAAATNNAPEGNDVREAAAVTAAALASPDAETAKPAPAVASRADSASQPAPENVNIYFQVSSYRLNDEGRATIQAVAQTLADNPGKKIHIIGYTSRSGSKEYNLKLARNRMRAVRRALLNAGVRQEQIAGSHANGEANMGSGAESRRVSILIK